MPYPAATFVGHESVERRPPAVPACERALQHLNPGVVWRRQTAADQPGRADGPVDDVIVRQIAVAQRVELIGQFFILVYGDIVLILLRKS